jgi:hypothetical protein
MRLARICHGIDERRENRSKQRRGVLATDEHRCTQMKGNTKWGNFSFAEECISFSRLRIICVHLSVSVANKIFDSFPRPALHCGACAWLRVEAS